MIVGSNDGYLLGLLQIVFAVLRKLRINIKTFCGTSLQITKLEIYVTNLPRPKEAHHMIILVGQEYSRIWQTSYMSYQVPFGSSKFARKGLI